MPPPNTTLLDGGNYGVPAYWNGNIYTTGQNFPLSQFSIANGVIATPQSAASSNMFPPRGGIPSVSANGTTGGVVWVVDYTGWQNNTPAVLDAYDATNVGSLLYSSPSSGANAAGPAVKVVDAQGHARRLGHKPGAECGPRPRNRYSTPFARARAACDGRAVGAC